MKSYQWRSARFSIPVVSSLALALALAARAAPPQVLTNPDVNDPIQADMSAPLRDIIAASAAKVYSTHEAPRVLRPKLQQLQQAAQRQKAASAAAAAVQSSISPAVAAAVIVNVLGVGTGFPNYTVPDAPTDANLAVGDTQVVQWVNVSYAVFDKVTGSVLGGPFDGNNFWKGFGGACEAFNDGDPVILFDKIAHRWVATQEVFGPYVTCIAVSTTPDALGTYNRYVFAQNGCPDYAKLAVQPDAYYQSFNNFDGACSAYVGARVCAYERAKMLTGNKRAKQLCFQTGVFDDSLLPADLDSGDTLPPAGQAEVYVGSIDNTPPGGSVIYQYLFHTDFAHPKKSTFTGAGGTIPINVDQFEMACGGFGSCIAQPDVPDQLDSLGDRLMFRLAYRNFSDHQSWVVSHSITSPSGQVGERWYEFRAPETSTALAVFQQGTFAPDSNYRWMGSIAQDKAGNLALGYSRSGTTAPFYPSIYFTGRTPLDPLGTMGTESVIWDGTGSQIDTANRWGDYTSMAIDGDGCTFWYTNQYYQTTSSFNWSTRVASIRFPTCL
jgi:hypothetical protein